MPWDDVAGILLVDGIEHHERRISIARGLRPCPDASASAVAAMASLRHRRAATAVATKAQLRHHRAADHHVERLGLMQIR